MKRKTSITKIASILTVLAMVWGGVACQPEAPVEPTKYTISFDSGVESITVEDGAVATEPTTAPEKTGYTFGGWLNGEAAYDWTKPVTSDLSLTAKWTAVEYTITYLPEGVETDNPTTYTIETETIVLDTNPTSPDAAKSKFVAWHVDSEEGDVVTEIAEGSTGNKTFYAEFSAEEPCVVKFMLGTTEEASTKVKKGDKITLPTGFEKYNLFSDADCTTAFDTTTAITEDTTIYVKLKTFTISYKVLPFDNVNPVEGETNGSISVEYGTVFTDEKINELAVEIPGYTYKDIFTDEACTVLFDNTKAITSDLTVYVLYEEEPCVVKFMLGTTEEASTKVKKGDKITLPTGFEKYSLFSDADCTTAFDTTTAITADTTIYLKLKTFIISYKVLPFDKVNPVEGETNGSMPVEYGTVFTDEEINAFAEEIPGYTYKGIFTDEACKVLFDNTNPITSDLTVYVLYEESINPVLWEGEEAVSTGSWAAGVSIDAKNFAGLTSGYALKVTYNDDPDSTTYGYHQFGFTSAPAGEATKLEGVDVPLNSYGSFELPSGGTYCYHPLSEKDITSLKTNGLYIGGYGVVISKVELKKYTNIVIDSSKNYTCFGGGEGELTTATPITISEDLGIGKPFSYETVLKIVDTKSYSNGGVIFDFEIPEGKSLADYSIEGLFYFPRGDDEDNSMYYKNVCLYAGPTLKENGYMQAVASVSTDWSSNNVWKSFAPIAAEGIEGFLAALKGNIQFAIGMNSDKGTYYLAKVTIYEK